MMKRQMLAALAALLWVVAGVSLFQAIWLYDDIGGRWQWGATTVVIVFAAAFITEKKDNAT